MSAAKKKSTPKRSRSGLSKKAGPSDFNRVKAKMVLYNTLPQFPDEFDTVIVSGFIIANAGATVSVTGYLATNSLLTSAHSGVTVTQPGYLDNWNINYESYRVVAYDLNYAFVSRSTGDANWSMVHTNEDTAFPTGSSWASGATLTFPHVFHQLVAGTGKSPCSGRINCPKVWLAEIVGSETFSTDDNYAGTINTSGVFTSPSSLTYAVYHSGLTSGTFAADNSPYCTGFFRQWVKFYGRRV